VLVASLAVCASIFTSSYGVAEEAVLWRALRSGGHVALLRHAIAPGTGDPPGFKLEDCSTQRNLSAAGRAQAERIGEQFRANGIDTARIFSSQWCRCIDTAKYLGLGTVEPLPFLNSFFRNRRDGDHHTKELMNWLDTQDLSGVTVLVTHQVNITALTGVVPGSGAMIIVRRSTPGTLSIVGTINPQ
jgi:phosphohistidine phosphatase SixA